MANILNLGLSAVATGTANVITATYSPAITLTDRRIVFLRIVTPNTTTTPTFNPNGLGAQTITKNDGNALAVGDLQGDVILMYDLANTNWELLMTKASISYGLDGYVNIDPTMAEIFHNTDLHLNVPDITLDWETASRILSTDASQRIKALSTTTYPSLIEVARVKGVTSPIQTQLDSKVFAVDFGNITNWSIADSTTYYLGLSTSVGTTTDQISFVPLYTGTIVAILTEVFSAGTVGSNTEDGTLTLFYNDGGSNVDIATDFKMGANRHFSRNFTGLSIAISTGVSYLRFTSPSYATNPTAIQLRVTLIIRL